MRDNQMITQIRTDIQELQERLELLMGQIEELLHDEYVEAPGWVTVYYDGRVSDVFETEEEAKEEKTHPSGVVNYITYKKKRV